MKFFVVALGFIFPLFGHGIRHVGNAGGESELLLWRMSQSLGVWAKACRENHNLCWNGPSIPGDFETLVANLELKFVGEGRTEPRCEKKAIFLNSEELYLEDLATPKSEGELLLSLLKGIYVCRLGRALPEDLVVHLLPVEKEVHKNFSALVGTKTDVLVSLVRAKNYHQELTSQIKCSNYRVISRGPSDFTVQCEGSGTRYLVFVTESEDLLVRYESGDDF